MQQKLVHLAEHVWLWPHVAHSMCKALLTEEAQKPWGVEYLAQEIKHNPRLKVGYTARVRAVRNWATFHMVIPDLVFDSLLTLQLGQTSVQLEHVGGGHAEDSIVVKVPQAQVLFLGDCYYPPPLHLRTPESERHS